LKANKSSPGIVLYFQNSGDQNSTLKLSPTYRRCELTYNLDDYGKGGGAPLPVDPVLHCHFTVLLTKFDLVSSTAIIQMIFSTTFF